MFSEKDTASNTDSWYGVRNKLLICIAYGEAYMRGNTNKTVLNVI
jgi:hypothetical protein